MGAKVTLFVVGEASRIAFPVFKIDFVAVLMVDRDDTNDPAVVMVDNCPGVYWRFMVKPEAGARLQDPCNRFLSWLKRSFLRSPKRG